MIVTLGEELANEQFRQGVCLPAQVHVDQAGPPPGQEVLQMQMWRWIPPQGPGLATCQLDQEILQKEKFCKTFQSRHFAKVEQSQK